ncbi:MAG: hypothetical protein ACQZ3N_07160 [cyanobacterium endosymbiont of Rhopalodia yunnanensis]
MTSINNCLYVSSFGVVFILTISTVTICFIIDFIATFLSQNTFPSTVDIYNIGKTIAGFILDRNHIAYGVVIPSSNTIRLHFPPI